MLLYINALLHIPTAGSPPYPAIINHQWHLARCHWARHSKRTPSWSMANSGSTVLLSGPPSLYVYLTRAETVRYFKTSQTIRCFHCKWSLAILCGCWLSHPQDQAGCRFQDRGQRVFQTRYKDVFGTTGCTRHPLTDAFFTILLINRNYYTNLCEFNTRKPTR